MTEHTPGPWRWEVNRAHKSIKLCGGPPNGGFGRYDLTVLDFKRYGMTGAAPVFWDWDYNRLVGEPHRADALAAEVPGREHHAGWFADIDHPDARLIAAAPDLFDAAPGAADILEHYAEYVRGLPSADFERHPYIPAIEEAAAKLRAAIAKARGAA